MLSTMNSTYFGGKIFTAFPVVISSLKRQSRTTVAAINKKGGKQQNVKGQRFDVQIGKDTSVPVTLGFTKSNELFVGRLAMIGFASAIIGELLTGKGALAQFGLETGIPITDTEPLVIGLVIFNLVAALLPAKGVFVPSDEEEEERPKGSLQDPSISILQPLKFLGISGFGFTKANELFVGRVAQLGFAFALIGEAVTGKGPLAQFDIETGLPLSDTEPLLLAFIAFTLFAAINEGTGTFEQEN
uniref:Chloroplast photosystem II 22 kDa PsbS protein psbS n=1 Tax=Acetabularia acetabulum TaxID=35845 RepID=A4QPL4_ACEAT|nr:TPA_inf: chloroplast photosystem II 22 kDa PsbS protein precursor psbS [Acetabularia acetabulum]